MENLKLSNEFFRDNPRLTAFLFLIYLIIICFPILSIVIFPFYVRVSRKNRKRDELVAIFPFTDYFYRVTCFTESLSITVIITSGIMFLIQQLTKNETLKFIIWNSIAAVMLLKINVTMVLNILISILSFYRFLLYFFPRTAMFDSFSK